MQAQSEFSASLWNQDLTRIHPAHQGLAAAVFNHATGVLGSSPFQRRSSRTVRSDGQTIFRTRLHRSFWLVLDAGPGGSLRLWFPDKEDVIQGDSVLPVARASATQWTRKREKFCLLAATATLDSIKDQLLAFTERVHEAAVRWYSRQEDSALTLTTLLGAPDPAGTAPLLVPGEEAFAALLTRSPACSTCGTNQRLSVVEHRGAWGLLCDEHHPMPSPWRRLAAEVMPWDARRQVWHRDGGRCAACGSGHYIEFDHVVPANRGGGAFSGSNCETNLRLKCRTCNTSKRNRLIP